MIIAVTYQNGEVVGHFGHAEQFQLYTTDNTQIVSSVSLTPQGSGHGYMTSLMKEHGVNTVICTSMGEHAKEALLQAGIEIILGVSGNADEAVLAYLSGELIPSDSNECSEGCCGGSEEGCGGGCGGCHASPRIIMEGKNAGKTLRVHYTGTLNDGSKFDSSYDRNEPIEFVCGAGMMIPGFDKAVLEMEVGQQVDVHLIPEEAYGAVDPNAVFTVGIAQLPGSEGLEVGQQVHLVNQMGQPFPVVVTAKDDTTITFDANHRLAGKELNFHIELVEIL